MSRSQTFKSRYGPWALVTGAARGMGAEFARQIAQRGIDIVLVDMLEDELAQTAEKIQRDSGRETRTIALDLSRPESANTIREQTEEMEVGLLVNNAAFSPIGPFLDSSLEDKLRTVAVNVEIPLILVHDFAEKMAARKRGGIILLSSASAVQGTAYVANYAATKAYNLILAEGLWAELREHGVDVLGFMPGTTRTPGLDNSKPHLERARLVHVMEIKPTVAEALNALGKRPSHTAGAINRWTAFLTQRVLPRKWSIRIVAKTMNDMYGP